MLKEFRDFAPKTPPRQDVLLEDIRDPLKTT